MKKLLVLPLCLCVIAGCKIMKGLQQFTASSKGVGMKDSLYQGMYVYTGINDKKQFMLLDLGAAVTCLFDSSDTHNDLTPFTNYPITDANGKKQSIPFYTVNRLSTNAVEGKNALITYVSNAFPVDNCNANSIKPRGIVGNDLYRRTNSKFCLHYDSLTFGMVNEIPEKYLEVPSRFHGGLIYIIAVVDGKELQFIFDTGFSGFIAVNDKHRPNGNPEIITHHFVTTLHSERSEITVEHYTAKSWQPHSGLFPEKPLIGYRKNSSNLLGLQFISRYNWIIDYKNEKLYVAPRDKKNIQPYMPGIPKTIMQNNQLIIGATSSKYASKYKPGQKIVGMNGKLFETTELCTLATMLNSNPNWDEMNLMIQ